MTFSLGVSNPSNKDDAQPDNVCVNNIVLLVTTNSKYNALTPKRAMKVSVHRDTGHLLAQAPDGFVLYKKHWTT